MKKTNELIRDLRIDHDLTQAEVAEILGISQQHYSLYENGNYELPLRHFSTLVHYYDVSADYLLGRCKLRDKTSTDTLYIAKDYSGTQLLRDVLSLGESARENLIQYLSYLKQIQSHTNQTK